MLAILMSLYFSATLEAVLDPEYNNKRKLLIRDTAVEGKTPRTLICLLSHGLWQRMDNMKLNERTQCKVEPRYIEKCFEELAR